MKTFQRILLCAALPATALWTNAALAYADFGQGKPISAQDLSGKKFCWNTGGWVIYGADGQYTNRSGTHRHWSVTEPGVLHIRNHYLQIELLADGRLHSYRYCLLCPDHDQDMWATECK